MRARSAFAGSATARFPVPCSAGAPPPSKTSSARSRTYCASARAPLVYLAPDLTSEAQRAAVAIADQLHAFVDGVTSATAAEGILAAQRRGRASATLGEIRNRADVLVFWAVDPALSYPRFQSRYAPNPAGVHVPNGRADRTVIAVDVGSQRGPDDADVRIQMTAEEESLFLASLRGISRGSHARRRIDPRTCDRAR